MFGKAGASLQRPSAPGTSSSLSKSPLPLVPLSSAPQAHTTSPQIPPHPDNIHHGQHEEPTGPLTAQNVPPGDRGGLNKWASFLKRVFGWIRRKLSLGRSRLSAQDPTEPARPTTPPQLPPGNAVPPESSVTSGGNIDNPREPPTTHTNRENGLSIDAQLELEGINVPRSSGPTVTSSDSPDSNRKEVTIGATRFILQNAASALKFAPIPNLDAIPDLLLKWLDVYETVGGNDESLKGLGDDILKAYDTVLEPLALSTDPIPDEVVVLIRRFHSTKTRDRRPQQSRFCEEDDLSTRNQHEDK
ncbi:uncharacterized protein EI90DRAFT_211800 [Cantharellus anzutake]|uniref:uncharacterized protein n=1 Tax=Cantharellus anzutake TaxID=1750568 RepID=UPI001903A0F1|nr:uncharacterized protein EI90DRAFT_211800 [Cantharellus anzutake]KAF8316981.1 hypothetical protein EI90DRAFT_211800 [Cantharellus anzutake]